MKKFSLIALSLLTLITLSSIKSTAQSKLWAGGYIEIDYVGPDKYPMSLPLDWEDDNFINYGFSDFGGNASSFATSPTDGSNNVLETIKVNGASAGARTQLGGDLASPIPFSATNDSIIADIYAANAGVIVRLIAESSASGARVETQDTTTAPDAWNRLVFDFGNPVNNPLDPSAGPLNLGENYDRLTIVYDVENPGIGDVFYLDSLFLLNATPENYRNEPLSYQVTLHFFRDRIPGADPLDPTQTVNIRSKSLNLAQNLTLDNRFNEGPVRQYCLNGNRVRTEGALYQNTSPIVLPPAKDWVISYGGGPNGEFRSNEYNNINPQQRFYIESKMNNFFIGAATGIFDQEFRRVFNPRKMNSVESVEPDPVASFCVGKRYDYSIPLKDAKNNDVVKYELANARTDNPTVNANYVQPAYPFDQPFPVQEPRITFDQNSGTMSFTPTDRFASLVTTQIDEDRRVYYRDGNTGSVLAKDTTVNTTFYESRFVIDNDCNSRLPDFIGVESQFDPQTGADRYASTFNSTQDAFEFDCGSTVLTFNLTEPMFAATLDKEDFRIGLDTNRTDTVIAFIDSLYYNFITPTEAVKPLDQRKANTNPLGEFNQVTLFLNKPIGPGMYNIHFKHGSNDNTTIKNKCDYALPLDEPYVKIYVNTDFTYEHPFEEYTYCFPAILDQTPPYPEDVASYTNTQFDPRIFYTWRLNPLDPNSTTDTISNLSLGIQPDGRRSALKDVSIPANQNPNILQNTLTWEVGVGLDFSKYDPFTGDTILKSICYDTDLFTVTRYENPEVNVPDYDLCPEDDFPVINLDSMVTKHNADPSGILFSRSVATFATPPSSKDYDQFSGVNWTLVSSGRPALSVPGQEVNRFNVFSSEVPLIVNGYTCRERDTFLIVKNQVDVELRRLVDATTGLISPNSPTDTIICPTEDFVSLNAEEYMFPNNMSYQWFRNGQPIGGETNDQLNISEEGLFLLEVTKLSALGSTCESADSINVRLADEFGPYRAACKSITFKNGSVVQVFNWDVSTGADGYLVRGITQDGDTLPWEEASGETAIQHEIVGEQLKLQVMPYNIEVPEDANCRFGPREIAEACDAVVRPINVFTPNGDGINDFLAFTLLELYPGSMLQVFNRWGEMVYEDDNYYNDWDGEDLKEGTYFYILKVNDDLYPEPFKGNFTIIR